MLTLADRMKAGGFSRGFIGKAALNDNSFFSRIEAGGGFTVRTYDRVVSWCAENWPAGVAWPAGVRRPQVAGQLTPAKRRA